MHTIIKNTPVLLMQLFMSFPPSATFMHQWIGSALVQIMACRLFSAKPITKSMLSIIINWTLLTHWPFLAHLTKIQNFSLMKMHLKISSVKWWPFCPGGDELLWPRAVTPFIHLTWGYNPTLPGPWVHLPSGLTGLSYKQDISLLWSAPSIIQTKVFGHTDM